MNSSFTSRVSRYEQKNKRSVDFFVAGFLENRVPGFPSQEVVTNIALEPMFVCYDFFEGKTATDFSVAKEKPGTPKTGTAVSNVLVAKIFICCIHEAQDLYAPER